MLACSDGHHPSGGGGGGGRLGRSSSVVVATPPHGAADRAQYPKDHAQDRQDATDHPKDHAVENSREDEADDANGDQVVPPMFGELVSRDSIRRAADRPAERCIRLRRAVRARCQGVGRARRWGDRSQTPAAYSDSPAASRPDFAYCCIASTFLPTCSIVFCHSAVGLNSTDSASSRAS